MPSPQAPRSKRFSRALALALLGGAALTASSRAEAQIDIEPPLPNVLLLIDNSGSMEYLLPPDANGNPQLPGALTGSACATPTATTVLNKWATLLSVLTGTISNFSCSSVPRTGAFVSEYTFNGSLPYDTSYALNFNRPLSNGCAIGPGSGTFVNYYDWPTNSFNYHDISGVSVACKAPWTQATDGILDTYGALVRFAMMTFDQYPNAGTGATGNTQNAATGMAGMWSYYLNWTTSGTPSQGNPPNCVPQTFEVGARNQAAPPWEGRLIPFGPYNATLAQIQTQNAHIQQEITALRPFGATPLAGMLYDAKNFLLNDNTTDPSSGVPFGPGTDPYYVGGCRKMYIILVTDGIPNQDMTPSCAQSGGTCPFPTPVQTVASLAAIAGAQQILTYVVGIGISNPTALASLGLTDCSQLNPATQCTNPPAALAACCTLAQIAVAGGTSNAYFANNITALKAQISAILSNITAPSTARTAPVFSSVGLATGQGAASAAGYRFISGFTTQQGGQLWTGNLQRERFVCTTPQGGGAQTAVAQQPQSNLGDNFAANVNFNDQVYPRQFFTYIAPTVNNAVNSGQSIRPYITANDGLGTYGMTATPAPTQLQSASAFASTMQANYQAMGLSSSAVPPMCSASLGTSSVPTCANEIVTWEDGQTNPGIAATRNQATCPAGSVCSQLGSIYHSTPVTMGNPREFIRDDSYLTFATQEQYRPLMLYTATTDGQLHAFKVATNSPTDPQIVASLSNNELWSFLPPVVLPNLLSSYNQQSILLDGPAVVGDVVYTRHRATTPTWNSVLVGSGGPAGGFYYALDITNPTNPTFLWQLSTDTSGNSLFGASTSQAALGTVVLPDTSVSPADVMEVAVAFLPGGQGSATTGSCTRNNATSLMASSTYVPRSSVQCFPTGAARSLSVVNLQTGQVLMNFRGNTADGPPGLTTNTMTVPFTAPITGVPVAYPGQTGQVTDHVYVGDADGALWRINVSSPNVAQWTASLEWDAYSIAGDGAALGQPIEGSTVVSSDPLGNPILMFSTGDQQLLSPNAAMVARVWSVSETINTSTGLPQVNANWYQSLINGERPIGSMAIFNSVSYFSTYAPATTGTACTFGSSNLYALNYQTAAPMFPSPGNPGTYVLSQNAPNTIVFGVAVNQTPSCSTTVTTTDPYFGSHTGASSVNGGTFQIVWQKGPGNGVTANPNVTTDSYSGIQSMNLPTPQQQTKVDSWATVVQ